MDLIRFVSARCKEWVWILCIQANIKIFGHVIQVTNLIFIHVNFFAEHVIYYSIFQKMLIPHIIISVCVCVCLYLPA